MNVREHAGAENAHLAVLSFCLLFMKSAHLVVLAALDMSTFALHHPTIKCVPALKEEIAASRSTCRPPVSQLSSKFMGTMRDSTVNGAMGYPH